MRFTLLDRITDLEPERRIRAVKNLTMGEEYLAEHFPGFPVLPGVLMLEAVVQAGAWLIRLSEAYRHSVIFLKEAKQIKYGRFVTPGRQLSIECERIGDTGRLTTLKVKGELDGGVSIQGRIILDRFNLEERHPLQRRQDQRLRACQMRDFQTLASPELRARLLERSALRRAAG